MVERYEPRESASTYSVRRHIPVAERVPCRHHESLMGPARSRHELAARLSRAKGGRSSEAPAASRSCCSWKDRSIHHPRGT